MRRSDQIGREEIKRRVDVAITQTFAELGDGASDKRWVMRELAPLVDPHLDPDVKEAIGRESLVRFVRRLLVLRNRGRNRAKQAGKTKGRRRDGLAQFVDRVVNRDKRGSGKTS